MKLSKPQYDFLATPAEFAIYGGAAGGGKTHAVTIDPLRHCQGTYAVPLFRGAIFRRTGPQLNKSGGLVDHCKALYSPMGAIYNHTHSEFRFPRGAKISLNTLQLEKNLNDYQGAQFDWLAIDEATHFSEHEVFYLQARCRSGQAGVKPVVRLTCNPDNDSWLYPFLSWWLNPETGFPIPERSGIVRHFTRTNNRISWFDEPQYTHNTITGARETISTSATFIPATLADNEALMEKDPSYKQRLLALPESERERFLEGSWLASANTATEWPREFFIGILCPEDHFPVPVNRSCVRMFSVDASKGKKAKEGDYSAIVCTCHTRDSDLIHVDSDIERRPPGKIIEDLFEFTNHPLHRIKSGDLIGIETLQFQELFRDMIMMYAAKHPEYALSRYIDAGNPIIPVEDTLPKHMRIRRLDKFIRARRFRFVESASNTLLLLQLKQFNGQTQKSGYHDDGPDALDMSMQLPVHLDAMFADD